MRARAKAKAKTKAKATPKAKSGILRDQSKNRKLLDIFGEELPQDLQDHFWTLSRDDRTNFVNKGIQRVGKRKLEVDTEAMYKLKVRREDVQRGREKMTGYIFQDLLTDVTTHREAKTFFSSLS